ncbi:hypothetical protein HZC07_02330, partial [Candidatus Micrarchaeota archaeon]|nr:hypothetical protein [Candidatus Micrarchaeota archaeon]
DKLHAHGAQIGLKPDFHGNLTSFAHAVVPTTHETIDIGLHERVAALGFELRLLSERVPVCEPLLDERTSSSYPLAKHYVLSEEAGNATSFDDLLKHARNLLAAIDATKSAFYVADTPKVLPTVPGSSVFTSDEIRAYLKINPGSDMQTKFDALLARVAKIGGEIGLQRALDGHVYCFANARIGTSDSHFRDGLDTKVGRFGFDVVLRTERVEGKSDLVTSYALSLQSARTIPDRFFQNGDALIHAIELIPK